MFDVRRTTDEAPWFAYWRSGRQTYPISLRGWALTIAFAIFLPTMVGIAAAVGNPAVSMGILAIIAIVATVYLAAIARHTRGTNDDA
jgi:hypothetical protein